MTRQGDDSVAPEDGRPVRLAIAITVAALLSLSALAEGRPATAQAGSTDVSSDCVVVPNGSDGRAICTFENVSAIFFRDLVDAVGGSETGSGIWIQAWGGQGGAAPDGNNPGGAGGAGGYAQTYYGSLSSYTAELGDPTALYLYYGGNGGSDSNDAAGAGGGASTLVASEDVTSGASTTAYGPCVVADAHALDQDGDAVGLAGSSGTGASCDAQSVVVLAGGGGGGGGTCGRCHSGKFGGAGGSALAGAATTVGRGAAGDSPYPNRGGTGGFAGTGGSSHKFPSGNAGDGIGGLGGPYNDSGAAQNTIGAYVDSSFVGADTNGHGGRGYTFSKAHGGDGGGGGGGFGGGAGGGQGGSSISDAAGSGGGGGGSYAYGGDGPPGGTPPSGAPSAAQGAVRVVIDGIPEPRSPLAACAIPQHGTAAAESLRGTTGGDEIYGHGGDDSIATGTGDDCIHAGGGDDTVRSGRGADRLVADGGNDSLRAGRGADAVDGEGGHHLLRGGRGADRIHARDGKRDTVHCGPGQDVVWADTRDRVGHGCETVHI